MTRYIAFLRAINVGGHIVRMTDLRHLFVSAGTLNVETFLASGNVLFDSVSTDLPGIENQLEARLFQSLGYEVPVFIRTAAGLTEIANHQPFSVLDFSSSAAFNIAFLKSALDESTIQELFRLETEIDRFAFHGREVYWLCQRKQSESTFSNAVLEKVTGQKSTLRGRQTVQKIALKLTS